MSNLLDEFFPRDAQGRPIDDNGLSRLGVVVGGSLSKGLSVKLEGGQAIEDLAVGRYVVVRGQNKRFFCMVTDVTLNSANPSIQNDPPNANDAFALQVYDGTVAFGTVQVIPMLMIDDQNTPRPVKTIPAHFSAVYNATVEDVNAVFGAEDETHFNVGAPLELEHTQVNLDLKRLVERSIGVFGKSGTGKSFLTRVLLAGVIAKNQGVNLIFDMHNDYGWDVKSENGKNVQGLKRLFNEKVVILTLDGESTRRRNAPYDLEVKLSYSDIQPEDIAMLRTTLNLSDAMIDAAYTLKKLWGDDWIERLLNASKEDYELDLKENTNIGEGTFNALQRRLERFQRWHFLTPEKGADSVTKIIHYLVEARKNVVLEFGRYGTALEAYILVANYLTRRIHEYYIEKVEKALGDKALEPPQLLITIEEAHKFLEPAIARQTIFGIIAREMRKYNVTLLIVDQRPSGIDEEVMSQIGTRITALLDNERDINAVLNGVSGAGGLREVLARLDTKQQAILMGHAVPMPVVMRSRMYDDAFYQSVLEISQIPADTEQVRSRLGGGGKRRI